MDEALLPSAFGARFTLLQRVGAGGSGSTWIARDAERGDECVLKVLVHGTVSEGVREDLRREAENLRALSHPNVVRFRDALFDPARGTAAIAMDRVEGETLQEAAGRGALPRADVLGVLVGCARGLGALHARGLVHRDLQPRNVVVTGTPGSRSAVLVDLGLSERHPRGMPKTFTGTLGFLAPEMLLEGAPDHRTDLYSLGAVLHFMLAGEPPADARAVLDALLRGDDPFPEVERRARQQAPPPFAALLGRLLSRYPAARFQSAAEVIEAVNKRFEAGYAVDSAEDRRPALSEPPFAGRSREMRAALRRLAEADRGRGDAVVVVRGRPGSGKSRFLGTVRRLLEYRGRPTVQVRPAGPAAAPFEPVFRALRMAAHRLAPGAAARLREAEEARAVAAGDPETMRARVRDLLSSAFAEALAAETAPAILVDDLADLDPGSLEVLVDLLVRPGSAADPVAGRRALLVSLPAEPARASGRAFDLAVRALDRDPAVFRVDLGPLAVEAVREIVEAVLPLGDRAGDLASRLHEAAEGLPGGVVEALRALLESGRVAYGPGGWTVRGRGRAIPIPKDAAAGARQRLERVAAAEREALRALAFAGGRTDRVTWRKVGEGAGLDEVAAAGLAERGLVREDPDAEIVSLSSAALGEVLLADLGDAGRAPVAARLADAARAAGLGDSPRAVAWMLAAGRDRGALAHGAAALRRLRLEARLAEGEDLARDLVEAARRSAGAEEAGALFLEAAYHAHQRRQYDVEQALAEEGLGRAGTPGDRRELLLRLCESDAARGRVLDARVRALEAEGPTEEDRVRAHLSVARACFVAGRFEESGRRVEELLPSLEGRPYWLLRALIGLAGVRGHFGCLEEADGLEERALGLAHALGDRGATAFIQRNLLTGRARMGRHRLVAREAERLLETSGAGLTAADEVSILSLLGSALESLGRWHRVREVCGRAAALAEAEGLRESLPVLFRRSGRAETALGDAEAARRHLTRALRASEEGGREKERVDALVDLAGIHLARGEAEEARRILGELRSGKGPAAGAFRVRATLLLADAQVFPPGEALARIDRLLLEDEARARRSDAMTLRLLGGRLRVQAERGEEARAGLEELVASLRKDGAVDDLASALSLLGAAHAACGREGPATRTFGRALRLARRLENVLVRAEVLETCGRSLRGRTGSEAAARSCLAEARDLFRAASLPGRAAAVEEHLQSPAPAGSWRGIPPERLAWVLEKTRRVNEAEDPAKVLVALLDAAIEATGAERGFLVLAAAAGGFEVQVARSMDAAEIGLPDRTLSASLVKTVLEEGKSVIAAEAREDPRFSEYFSVRNLQLRSVLAVPIARGARVLGAFYLDNRFLAGVFTEEHRAALEMLAGQAALAFENVKFREEVRALNLRLQERVEVQGKELDGLRTSMRDLRQETRYAYREIFRRRGPMVEALRLVDHAVENTLPVLLEGESGTGKELVARALHFEGPQRERPFVVVNCAAIPEALMESELFGHRKGAFTGAVEDREGLVEAADGGTLFLDEIGDLPLGLQPKLLRVLQFGEFTPLGGGETRRARVRVVAATNRDLRLRVAEGNFREDLYFRLAVFPVRLPPLRDRVEDLPVLAQALVRRFAEEAGHGPRRLSRKAVARLLAHDWPGNIRELENALRRAVLLVAGDVLEAEDLALESRARPETGLALDRIRAGVPGGLRPREELALRRILERGMLTLRDLVAMSGASKATAARDLQRLVEARVLARRGKTSAAWYEVAPRFAEAPEPNLRRDGPAAS